MINPEEPQASDFSEKEVLQSEIFDHLGLVAGPFEEFETERRIDDQIAQDFEEHDVSVGHAIKALVLTGPRFSSSGFI